MRQILFIIISLSLSANTTFSQTDNSKLREALLSETPIENDLKELCEIGGRVTGSKQNKKSVNWAHDKFLSAGVDAIIDPFEMPVLWLGKRTTAKVSGGIELEPELVAKYQSPPGKYSGELVLIESLDEDDPRNKDLNLKGKFAIVETELCLDINGLFAEYGHATQVEAFARKRGAKGIVFMASRAKKLLYRFITSKTVDEDLPQFVMARVDAQKIITTLQEGKAVNFNAKIKAKTGGSFTSHNVIAEIKGSKFPDEIIIIGSHLDSWALGDGANDNGCNVSMLIDIARQMKKLGIKPDRTIRFALWNGEEQGYFGSWDYTKDHINELDRHRMAMSIDIGSGAITGFFTNGREPLVGLTDRSMKEVEDLGPFNQINAPIVGTDNFDFMLQGVPNLVGNQKPQVYGLNYHASSDTYDKVDITQLKKNAAIVAQVTLYFANAPAKAYKKLQRQDREEIHQMFLDNNLEFTMRMFNVWEPWVNKTRGRQ